MSDEKEVAPESNGQEHEKDAAEPEKDTDDTSDLEESIIRQVEYYFGDINIVRDKFLREQVKLDEGWVPLEILIKFNRLAKLSTDIEIIANALNKSTSGLLEVSDDNKKVRRSPEMPVPEMNEELHKEILSRTIYAKGFPKDATLDEVLKYFKEHGDVENVVMRRWMEKQTKARKFKGSVFATFKVKEDAKKFIEKGEVKYGEAALITLWQEDYLKQKQEEYNARKEKKEKKSKDRDAEREEKSNINLPLGAVLQFSDGHNTMKREDIKDALQKHGAEIAYIDFKLGDTEGWVRLTKENAAKEIIEKITDGKLKIGESDVKFKVLDGDEEKAFIDKSIEEMTKRRKNAKNFSKNKNKNHYKGKGRKRRQDDDNEVHHKKVKTDS